ncbi:uncharacterized protein MELLADRAFT_85390 [Melampsora larici-populina 98AG31]|uniref:Uncharacterized protein n=1 Tax=Melampsora larici-populina (strain 98AG31 / pathotype 3-4-7) TaxID=747676 RepID=F4RII5_MELLP|nr:uncharacterized protein MELLADRAFT_85390 [Melampsora larici-populina 98AG31]EGG07828.1 hypothetical protein MELLADRAFT_85390 [Melampsora larici-populina 98AG31]
MAKDKLKKTQIKHSKCRLMQKMKMKTELNQKKSRNQNPKMKVCQATFAIQAVQVLQAKSQTRINPPIQKKTRANQSRISQQANQTQKAQALTRSPQDHLRIQILQNQAITPAPLLKKMVEDIGKRRKNTRVRKSRKTRSISRNQNPKRY